MLVIERIKGFFGLSAKTPQIEPIPVEDQRKIAEAVLADFKSIDVERAVRVPAVVKKHFDEVLRLLGEHGVVDVKSLPAYGKKNAVIVPEGWGPSLIAVVNGVFAADKWSGRRSDMRAMWDNQVSNEFKKLRFPEATDVNTGDSMKHMASSLFLSNHTKVQSDNKSNAPKSTVTSETKHITHTKQSTVPAPTSLQ
jgi:hypothetical protein